MFASTGGALLSPDTDFMNFVNLGSQNTPKAVQEPPEPKVVQILRGSGFFFYETRTVITVRFSPEAQSGHCVLPEIVWHRNSIFSLV